jgi:hypothetical protein
MTLCKGLRRRNLAEKCKFRDDCFFATSGRGGALRRSRTMTILSIHGDNPLADGRQSERALKVRRGVQRLLSELRHAVLPELTLASGRRADLISLSAKGEIWIVEIKTSIEDFRIDRKWPDYRLHCDRLFFATHADVPLDIFPEECGLMLSDGYGAHMLREAPEHRLAGNAKIGDAGLRPGCGAALDARRMGGGAKWRARRIDSRHHRWRPRRGILITSAPALRGCAARCGGAC